MKWTVQEPPGGVPVSYVVVGVVAAIVGITHWQSSNRYLNLNAFPTVGSSGWLGSWWAGIKYMTNAAEVIREGYRKHKGAPFKIATFSRWVVVVSRHADMEELRNARDDELSFVEAMNEDFNSEFTMGSEVFHNPYHITVMRTQLTRNIGVLYPDLRDEIIEAFDEILDLKHNEWKSVLALTTVQQIICRASNRVFVGLPLCRDPDFIALNIQYAIDSIKDGLFLRLFPKVLRPVAARFTTNVPRSTRRGVGHLRPIIEERRKYLNKYEKDWIEKPHDLLSWLIVEGGPDATVEALTNRVLSTNVAAIHITSNVFTQALYNLAANPCYVRPLRDEVDTIVEKEGWSKTSLGKMRKVDSFLKESIRMEGVQSLGLMRKAKKDFTLSDGTLIPKGTRISAGMIGLHYDDALYENPEVFDPFRFADMGEEDEESAKHRFAATYPEYLPFGYGRHACPGRFFAAAEVKTMLAHIVTTYDVRLEENMTRPRSSHIGSSIVANSTAKVMFRKRTHQDGER